jgi:hypothetical protein
MASSIDATKPVTGSPTTESVRTNFLTAKTEISALQTDMALKAPLASPTFTGTVTAATLNAATFQIGGVTLTATPATLNALNGRVTALEGSTGNETITLTGDVSGSGTTSIDVTVDMADLSGAAYAAGSGAAITALNASNLSSGSIPAARVPEAAVTQHEAAIDAGSVDGYDIVVDSGSPSGTDANTIYFVT